MIRQANKKIILITTGQPSTNPRMIKEIDALLSVGYNVKVLYSYWAEWAAKTDPILIQKYPKNLFEEIGGDSRSKKNIFWVSRVIHKLIRCFSSIFPFLNDYALARTSFLLAKAAKKQKADLYIAHNLGALPAAAKAAKKFNTLYAFDAEDYHRGEYAKPTGKYYTLTKKLESKFLPGSVYITAASPLIADAYNKITPASNIQVVNNVFSKKYLQAMPEKKGEEGLCIFWFSQTIGANRGLETIIAAINLLPEYKVSLHLMGHCSEEYRNSLIKLSSRQNTLYFLQPEQPDHIFSIAAQFDIGLAAEEPHNYNRNFCLTNKIFTYLLAGNFILASATLAQKQFMEEYGGIGSLFDYNDVKGLASLLKNLYSDNTRLFNCRKNALELATTKLNWEEEQKIFLHLVAKAVS